LNVSVTSTPTFNPTNFASVNTAQSESLPTSPAALTRELVFNLGLWLSGLESFLQIRNQAFGEGNQSKAAARDWTKEFGLTNSTLLLCSKYALQLGKILNDRESLNDGENDVDFLDGLANSVGAGAFSFKEISALSLALKDAILINEALLRSAPLKFAEWTAWSNVLTEKLKQVEVIQRLIDTAEHEGENFLPQILRDLLQNKPISLAAEADLRVVLPLFAKILKWLDVIGKMHDNDEPLKPTLLLFARIHEQTQEMMRYVNNRLRRFANEDDELFSTLDCTVYAASIEVRKVFNFELTGLSEIRQTPLIYAKVETAHGLLNDCFQQIIVNFAQLLDPEIQPTHLFPNFQVKLEQSLALRSDLWSIQQAVQQAERNQKDYPMEKLHKKLNDFVKTNMRFLFYKDVETVERFIEEVLRTHNKNDVVPILHRFGAYLETLLGQVNMRIVLANYPFDYPKE
jgi:hypothetical protein